MYASRRGITALKPETQFDLMAAIEERTQAAPTQRATMGICLTPNRQAILRGVHELSPTVVTPTMPTVPSTDARGQAALVAELRLELSQQREELDEISCVYDSLLNELAGKNKTIDELNFRAQDLAASALKSLALEEELDALRPKAARLDKMVGLRAVYLTPTVKKWYKRKE